MSSVHVPSIEPGAEGKLCMQILESNAARLSPDYSQRCKCEWGIEGSPFDVSFIAAPRAPNVTQKNFLQCANGTCSKFGILTCMRCMVSPPLQCQIEVVVSACPSGCSAALCSYCTHCIAWHPCRRIQSRRAQLATLGTLHNVMCISDAE